MRAIIYRAELAACHFAQRILEGAPLACVATDSACAISLVRRCVLAPHLVRPEHRHAALGLHMAAQLASAGGTLCLYMVAAHRGVIGNEVADSIARQVARGDLRDNTAELTVRGVIPGTPAGAPPSNDSGGPRGGFKPRV